MVGSTVILNRLEYLIRLFYSALDVEGIFRISAASAGVQMVTKQINKGNNSTMLGL